MSGTKKSPFGLLNKDARKKASDAGTQALNAESNSPLSSDDSARPDNVAITSSEKVVINQPADRIPNAEPEAVVKDAILDEQTKQDDSMASSKIGRSTTKKGRGGEKPSGPVAGSTARVTSKGIRILHLLSSVTGQPQYEVIEDCLKLHPVYPKIKGLV